MFDQQLLNDRPELFDGFDSLAIKRRLNYYSVFKGSKAEKNPYHLICDINVKLSLDTHTLRPSLKGKNVPVHRSVPAQDVRSPAASDLCSNQPSYKAHTEDDRLTVK